MFVPLHLHSHFSLLDGLSQPEQIAKRCAELGYKACALTDHGVLSGSVQHYKECKAVGIKPIMGCEMYVVNGDATNKEKYGQEAVEHLVVLAQNKTGWNNLVKMVSRSNDEDVFYYKPRLDLNMLSQYSEGILCFSGHPGSELAACMFDGRQPTTYLEAAKALRSDYYDRVLETIEKYKNIFGDRFYVEIQLVDNYNMSSKNLVAEILRKGAKETGTQCVATGDSHYVKQEDNQDQWILLCSSLNTTLPQMNRKIKNGEKAPMAGFFKANEYHIPEPHFMTARHQGFEEEILTSAKIAERIEEYNILGKPKLPQFDCPAGISEDDYLRELALQGWDKRLGGLSIGDNEIYHARLDKELRVFQESGLAGYFLIVQDYVNWAKKQGQLIGPGRGSGAGCLTSYLTNITGINPLPYDLLFERFYNSGRNTKDHISFPDIDIDFPVDFREPVMNYIRDKYGHKNVSQLITFGRLQGKSAIKEVLRIHEACDFDTMNEITRQIPGEAEIMDKLEEAKETSILRWVLENEPKQLEKWCRMKDDGSLEGEMAVYFQQAIRIEGTYKSSGKHAAGLVISSDNLNDVCPMVRDKNKEEKIAGLEMEDLEAMGHIKFDILGVASLSKLQKVRDLLRGIR